jgi:hypothetical protein
MYPSSARVGISAAKPRTNVGVMSFTRMRPIFFTTAIRYPASRGAAG